MTFTLAMGSLVNVTVKACPGSDSITLSSEVDRSISATFSSAIETATFADGVNAMDAAHTAS